LWIYTFRRISLFSIRMSPLRMSPLMSPLHIARLSRIDKLSVVLPEWLS
jgi:hypothetical protein